MTEEKRCAERVHNDYGVGFHQCTRTGKYYDPKSRKWYCKQHHPKYQAERKAKQISCAWRGGCDVRVSVPEQLCQFHADLWRVQGPREYAAKLEQALEQLLRQKPCTHEHDLAKEYAKRVLKEKVSPYQKR